MSMKRLPRGGEDRSPINYYARASERCVDVRALNDARTIICGFAHADDTPQVHSSQIKPGIAISPVVIIAPRSKRLVTSDVAMKSLRDKDSRRVLTRERENSLRRCSENIFFFFFL